MLKEITTVIQKFLQFLKSPKDRFAEPVTSTDRYRIFTVLFFAAMLLNLLVIVPLLGWVDEHVMEIEKSNMLSGFTIWFLLFIAAVFAPVWEEFVFRFPLKLERNYLVRWADKIVGKPVFSNFWNRHFAVIFYLIALLFGFVHSFNFTNEWNALFLVLLPLLILSQSITGLFLGYIRLRLGFLWAVLFHACFNFVLITAAYLSYQHTEIINDKNTNYELRIVGLFCRDSSSSYFTQNKQKDKIYLIEGTNMHLSTILNFETEQPYKIKDDPMVNFHFKSDRGMTEQELIKRLKEEFEITER